MERAWEACKDAVHRSRELDTDTFPISKETLLLGKKTAEQCRVACDLSDAKSATDEVTDSELARLARYTDRLPLKNYKHVFYAVPEMVNVVTVFFALLVQ
jgi:hypothetical protein